MPVPVPVGNTPLPRESYASAIGFAQVIVEGCHIVPQADRPPDVLHGNLVLAHLGSEHAEKMDRVGLIRFDRENLPIDLFGGL